MKEKNKDKGKLSIYLSSTYIYIIHELEEVQYTEVQLNKTLEHTRKLNI